MASRSAFIRSTDLDWIEIPDVGQIGVKRRFSFGDQRQLASVLSHRDPTVATRAYLLAVLEIGIVDWKGPGFEDENGKVLPRSSENLNDLNPEVADQIIAALVERNPTTGVSADKDPFVRLTSQPSAGTEPAVSPTRSGPSSGSASDTDGAGTSS